MCMLLRGAPNWRVWWWITCENGECGSLLKDFQWISPDLVQLRWQYQHFPNSSQLVFSPHDNFATLTVAFSAVFHLKLTQRTSHTWPRYHNWNYQKQLSRVFPQHNCRKTSTSMGKHCKILRIDQLSRLFSLSPSLMTNFPTFSDHLSRKLLENR